MPSSTVKLLLVYRLLRAESTFMPKSLCICLLWAGDAYKKCIVWQYISFFVSPSSLHCIFYPSIVSTIAQGLSHYWSAILFCMSTDQINFRDSLLQLDEGLRCYSELSNQSSHGQTVCPLPYILANQMRFTEVTFQCFTVHCVQPIV